MLNRAGCELVSKYYVDCNQRVISEKIKIQLHCCGYDNIMHSNIIQSQPSEDLGETYIIPVCGVPAVVKIDIYTIDDKKSMVLLWVNMRAAYKTCKDKVVDLVSMIKSYLNGMDTCIQFGFESNLFKEQMLKS